MLRRHLICGSSVALVFALAAGCGAAHTEPFSDLADAGGDGPARGTRGEGPKPDPGGSFGDPGYSDSGGARDSGMRAFGPNTSSRSITTIVRCHAASSSESSHTITSSWSSTETTRNIIAYSR